MKRTCRREVLSAVAVGGLASVAGCLAGAGNDDRARATDDPTATPDGSATDPAALTEWTRSTDCDGMHDSVVKVNNVVEGDLSDTYAPVAYGAVTPGEREILDVVLAEGGYGTCDPGEGFDRLVERTYDVRDRQDGEMAVFVERDGVYYGLYVEKADQVFAG